MKLSKKNQFALECFLVLLILSLTVLMNRIVGFKIIVLNLYFLPALLGAFFMGRYRAGVLALFSVVCVTIVAGWDLEQFATTWNPLSTGLAITIWAAALGLTTMLAGTLSDERTTQITELHEAYFGVIEVLSKYLHSVQPNMEARPLRIADLSQQMGVYFRMSERELDDIRVASLLQEMDHIEITARVVRRALGTAESTSQRTAESTFHATDLVQSLGSVINGALPLLCRFDESMNGTDADQLNVNVISPPLGAQIIRTAREFDRLVYGQSADRSNDPVVILTEMQAGLHGVHLLELLSALEHVIQRQNRSEAKARARVASKTKAVIATPPTSTAS
jgi:hypothetical protein